MNITCHGTVFLSSPLPWIREHDTPKLADPALRCTALYCTAQYPHVAAVYWSLYRLGRWGSPALTHRADWTWYLKQAVGLGG